MRRRPRAPRRAPPPPPRAAAAAAAAAAVAVTAAEGQQAGGLAQALDEPVADASPEAEASVPAKPTHTQPIPLVDAVELQVEELGLADRLGLDAGDDEVGPTS
ncbi:hypothetical protein [Microbacterium trichothecenolyticum]